MIANKTNKRYIVYRHMTPNGKIYIGITSRMPEQRWRGGHGYRDQQYFWKAIQKYGWYNIQHDILCFDLDKETAETIEKEMILLYQSYDRNYGYNIELGGRANCVNEETKEKISKNNAKYWSGKTLPEYVKQKISKANKGKKLSQETIEKTRKALTGRPVSEETRRKIGKANKGNVPYMKGKHLSDETKRKIVESRGQKMWKKVICIETGQVFDSIKLAEEFTGLRNGVGSCVRGINKTSKGYHWKYYDEYLKEDK